MVPIEKILQSFVSDSLRMCSQARECLTQITEQSIGHRVSPAMVRSFYQLIHSLKGTASMIEGAEAVVNALHALEARLTCQDIVTSARKPDWLPLARQSLEKARLALEDLQRKARMPDVEKPALVRGLLVKACLGEIPRLYWFPASCVGRVIPAEEMEGQSAISVEGAWITVVGNPQPGALGLTVQSSAGSAVLRIEAVVGIFAWSQASAQGAKSGLDLLAEQKAA